MYHRGRYHSNYNGHFVDENMILTDRFDVSCSSQQAEADLGTDGVLNVLVMLHSVVSHWFLVCSWAFLLQSLVFHLCVDVFHYIDDLLTVQGRLSHYKL